MIAGIHASARGCLVIAASGTLMATALFVLGGARLQAYRSAQAHIASVESGPLAGYQRHTAPAARRATGRQWVFFMTAQVLDGYGR
jgi:hypothetical protein